MIMQIRYKLLERNHPKRIFLFGILYWMDHYWRLEGHLDLSLLVFLPPFFWTRKTLYIGVLNCSGFSTISRLLETIRMEHIDKESSLDPKLQIGYICSVRIPSRNRDIIGKPMWRIKRHLLRASLATSLRSLEEAALRKLLTVWPIFVFSNNSCVIW